jgi:hypothetical protein
MSIKQLICHMQRWGSMLSLLLVAIHSPTSNAASVRFVPLDEMVDTAAIAFHGRVTGNRSERDSLLNVVVTYTTFEVTDVLKGNVGKQHTIKQIGGVLPDGSEGYRVHGVPRFAVGEEVVVYLAGVSQWGFSSPIGLQQGQFTVTQSEAGKVVSNGSDFRLMAPDLFLDAKNPEIIVPYKATPQIELDKLKQYTRLKAAGASKVVIK